MQGFPVWLHAFTPYLRLMRLHRPTGILLLLWPCWWSITLAGFKPSLLIIFALGAILMRGAGCIINDLWDKDIDAKVSRTKNRPLASGEIKSPQAISFLALLLFLSLLLLLTLNTTTQVLGVCSLIPVAIYPLMKRFIPIPQAFLGLTFSWGALMGWTAATGTFGWPMLWLYLAAFCWTIGYDTIYALQDKPDDELIGIRSSARLFGDHVKLGVSVCYALTLIFLMLAKQSSLYFFCLTLFGAQLFWQVRTVDVAHAQNSMAVFRSNGLAGAVVFAGILLG